jgi:outer membrane protein TolC
VAIADMLPQFAIDAGTWGSTALSWASCSRPTPDSGTSAPRSPRRCSTPGALLHKHRAADAALDQAGAQYRAAVILACQNVADTLRALQADADALKAKRRGRARGQGSVRSGPQQRELGTISRGRVLNAEQAYQQANWRWCRRRPTATPTPRAVSGARRRLVESSGRSLL